MNNEQVARAISIGDVTYYKHPTHWYPDGNTVFLVEDTVIQVFRCIIHRRSAVLRAMLESPDGLGAYHLDDNLKDFSFLLNIITPRTCSQASISIDKKEWRNLIGLTQVAQKYEVGDVVACAVEVLEEMLPTVQHPAPNTNIYDDPDAAVDVIRFSRRCHLSQFLRSAFSALAT